MGVGADPRQLPPDLDLLPDWQYITATCCWPALADIRRGF
jgi:hypothetical protein